jgi:small-conductance mechanosensitive channel
MTHDDALRVLAVLAGALALGLLVRWAFGWLAHRVSRTRSELDDLLVALGRGAALPVALLIGLRLTAEIVPLSGHARTITSHVIAAATVLVVTVLVARLAGALVSRHVDRSASIFASITRGVVLAVGALVALSTYGLSITPLLTAFGVGGLAVALALQDTLANLFAGIHLLASKKVQTGDYVKLDSGEEGYITDINWRNTSIRQVANIHTIVPNSHLAQAVLTNYYRPERETSHVVQVGVSYDSDLAHVERVTIDVARQVQLQVPGAVRTHDPVVRFHTFNDSSIDFSVVLRLQEITDQYVVRHELIKRLKARYDAEGIVIPFPIRTVVLPDAPGSTEGANPQ